MKGCVKKRLSLITYPEWVWRWYNVQKGSPPKRRKDGEKMHAQ